MALSNQAISATERSCCFCEVRSRSPRSLYLHIVEGHKDLAEIRCERCPFVTKDEAIFSFHKSSKHSNDNDEEQESLPIDNGSLQNQVESHEEKDVAQTDTSEKENNVEDEIVVVDEDEKVR